METFRKAMCFALLFAAVLTLVGCVGNKNDEPQLITDISQFSGCGIGVVTGSAFDTMTDEYIESADKQCYESYAFAFSETDEDGAIRDRFNEFLSQITADGTLDEIKAKWLGDD